MSLGNDVMPLPKLFLYTCFFNIVFHIINILPLPQPQPLFKLLSCCFKLFDKYCQ